LNSITEAISSPAREFPVWVASLLLVVTGIIAGCDQNEPIVPYDVPTKVPAALLAERDRMLAAIVPKDNQAWFFKVTGPESEVESLASDFRRFVEKIEFQAGEPLLDSLPDGWRRGGEKPMRFATLDVDLANKQLNISVSKLGLQEDWDEQIKMNVNRWRGQLGLPASEEKWAAAGPLDVGMAESPSVWVDLLAPATAADKAGPSMMADPPFGGAATGTPLVQGSVETPTSDPTPSGAASGDADVAADPRLKYDLPEGWRAGRMTSMRMAAFRVGPEDLEAEFTVIPAGGDLRGNVARWLGQVREGEVPAEVVDQALTDAQKIDVDGRSAQRFLLSGDDASSGTIIDATIVPLEDGFSLFMKMTGPAETVSQQSDNIATFLESLELNL
jgi:HAMP domain-containing protein